MMVPRWRIDFLPSDPSDLVIERWVGEALAFLFEATEVAPTPVRDYVAYLFSGDFFVILGEKQDRGRIPGEGLSWQKRLLITGTI
jgi:hypothetical protein